ncbi:MAG: tRNA (N6-threonylcarbamoyladenosine(37)-N6)-methyltransferase TrmO [Desulfobacterales bacterium]|nr:tRNA (N6-threonylcarbamoyladenosine(37)-N6)-methyltransferase TrmO [Desulfobacterales bacterium]MDD4071856.1 tRNA (N6-threonylcarbamoyladenosine(37)-N6)-methyltransferase TrmO [Desulfobacterales bacterium]MDD4391517.1 tRNA (N6-threonylcarbamoyladenosine(37)-N6)-methyltransferase TrmO [Desulfobacterales bacterium]
MQFIFTPIGIIHTPFEDIEAMPIQPSGARDVRGQIIIDEQYTDGLDDLEGFSHLILLYAFHKSKGFNLKVKPFMDTEHRGVFACRAPRRPNQIGLSVVRLLKRQGNILHIEGIDVLTGTPLLDIKPYVPAFDSFQTQSIGWLKGRDQLAETLKADRRFEK